MSGVNSTPWVFTHRVCCGKWAPCGSSSAGFFSTLTDLAPVKKELALLAPNQWDSEDLGVSRSPNEMQSCFSPDWIQTNRVWVYGCNEMDVYISSSWNAQTNPLHIRLRKENSNKTSCLWINKIVCAVRAQRKQSRRFHSVSCSHFHIRTACWILVIKTNGLFVCFIYFIIINMVSEESTWTQRPDMIKSSIWLKVRPITELQASKVKGNLTWLYICVRVGYKGLFDWAIIKCELTFWVVVSGVPLTKIFCHLSSYSCISGTPTPESLYLTRHVSTERFTQSSGWIQREAHFRKDFDFSQSFADGFGFGGFH